MKDLINQIIAGNNIEEIYNNVISSLFTNGPVNKTDLEILCYLHIYQNDFFKTKENQVLKYMGLNYKRTTDNCLGDVIFGIYSDYIKESYGYSYTPVQANIANNIGGNSCFSFSAPTSTGKSYVFRNLIQDAKGDVVIVVPSRALINEYYHELIGKIENRRINILTFIDRINTKHSDRNVFIVTPERCKDLFKFNKDFDIDYFLFDEAQLSNEESSRGMYFDSIVRRAQSKFPKAKYVFAHPFVSNPEAQIIKNHFNQETSFAKNYQQNNVGQMFYAFDKEGIYHFGLDKDVMGKRKVRCNFDPIEKALNQNGSVLIYCTKSSIYNKSVIKEYSKYLRRCEEINATEAINIINQIKTYIGAEDKVGKERYSLMLNLMKCGVVIHHGSLPLQVRQLIEEFTQKGYCRVCFATSTLEQGVNMPFDVVVLNTFKASKPLSLKNLIGRAGRSTKGAHFDYGSVVMKTSCMSKFREIMKKDEELEDESMLEREVDDDLVDFKNAVINGTLSDEYNISEKQLSQITTEGVNLLIQQILDILYKEEELQVTRVSADRDNQKRLISLFVKIYEAYLQRELVAGEKCVLDTSIKILLWQIQCKTFKDICFYRYSYATNLQERKDMAKRMDVDLATVTKMVKFKPKFMMPFNDIPNKELKAYSLFDQDCSVNDIDYDLIVFDTYDYLDKIIGFKLTDIYYASVDNYYKSTLDTRAKKLARLIKYGTDDEKEIWMKRYGFSFEEIEWLDSCVEKVSQEEIVFNNNVYNLTEEQLLRIRRFKWD